MVGQTISFEEINRKRWDCAVIGAGPAGALAAREIARAGASVLLIDKSAFPRYKVCGCCLNPRALAILKGCGLGQLTPDLQGVPLHALKIAAGKRCATIPIPEGVALSRTAFDAALIQSAIEAGAAFLPETSVSLETRFPDPLRLQLQRRNDLFKNVSIESRVVIAATGLGGKFDQSSSTNVQIDPTSRIGAGVITEASPDYPAGIIHMACGTSGYVGIVRIEDDKLDIAAAFDAPAVKQSGGLGALAVRILDEAGFPPIDDLANLAWKGTPFLTRRTRILGEDHLYRIGDAAGYVEPFTGEGMAWALASGLAVAPIVMQELTNGAKQPSQQWSEVYRKQVARRQMTCRAVSAALRYPNLTRKLVRILSAVPSLASPVLRQMYRL